MVEDKPVLFRSITFGELGVISVDTSTGYGDISFKTSTGYINATLHVSTNSIHIERVFTEPEFRRQGHFKADLRAFFKGCKGYEVSVCVCPDRLPDYTYNVKLEDALIKVFMDFKFKPYEDDGDVYPTDLSRNF